MFAETEHHVHWFTSHLNSPQPIPKIVSSKILWTDEWKTINLLNYDDVELLVNRRKNENENSNKNSTESHSILVVLRFRYLHARNDNLRICVQIMQWNFVISKYTYGHTPNLPLTYSPSFLTQTCWHSTFSGLDSDICMVCSPMVNCIFHIYEHRRDSTLKKIVG